MRRCSLLPLVRCSTLTATSCTPPRSALYTRPCGPAHLDGVHEKLDGQRESMQTGYASAEVARVLDTLHHVLRAGAEVEQRTHLSPAARARHPHGSRSRCPPPRSSTPAPADPWLPSRIGCWQCCQPVSGCRHRCHCGCQRFLGYAVQRTLVPASRGGHGASGMLRSTAAHHNRSDASWCGRDAPTLQEAMQRHLPDTAA
jgi:hypothetical protein